jgi:cobyrinic acid a,c-diamide synthase
VSSKGFVVAGPSSGVGKTTVALGLMAALRARGLAVQPFKCGPDFIDPGHHTRVCGRASRNLDTWMVAESLTRQTFHSHAAGADIAVVEGVMGMFDGAAGSGAGSTAATARLLELPVILVVDASKMAASAAALVHGFTTFDPNVRVAGVIFNKVAGDSHYALLTEACASLANVVALGYLPRESELHIPERHLGLLTVDDGAMSAATIARLATLIEAHVDLDRLLALAGNIDVDVDAEVHVDVDVDVRRASAAAVIPSPLVRIGVARDQAFCFYYEDNLDALRAAGAELIPFSPLQDADLPANLDALYFGGGYPEVRAEALSANEAMRAAIARFVADDGTVYAECGGLMYLSASIRTTDGATWPMVGALPFDVRMTDRLQRFGYVEITLTRDCLLGDAGATARGHSFHYSDLETIPPDLPCAYDLRYTRSQRSAAEGFAHRNVLASYIHVHFDSRPGLAHAFVDRIRQARPDRS